MKRKPKPPDPGVLDRLYAEARRKRDHKLAKYALCAFGLGSDTVGDVTIDGAVALIQPHADAILCLCPLAGMPQPLESVAWYYADCIAYEHDIPVIVLPTRGDLERFGYRYALGGTSPREEFIVHHPSGRTSKRTIPAVSAKSEVKDFYTDQLCLILEEVRGLRDHSRINPHR